VVTPVSQTYSGPLDNHKQAGYILASVLHEIKKTQVHFTRVTPGHAAVGQQAGVLPSSSNAQE
jgi:hypothetical protein